MAARHLHDWGAETIVLLLAARSEDDANLRQLVERDARIEVLADDGLEALDEALNGADVVLDTVLGTGRARALEGVIAQALERVRVARGGATGLRVIAVDVPTGVDADTGAVDQHTLAADTTVALGVSKIGLHTLPGSEYAGRVEVVDIGLAKEDVDALPTELLNARWVRERMPPRPAGANKGTFGRVLVVAGSERYVGAARLASLGALRAGAGLVTLACPRSIQSMIAGEASEITYLPLADREGAVAPGAAVEVARVLDGYDVLAAGPGLGQGPAQEAFVRQLLTALPEGNLRVLIDADGLNNLSRLPGWWEHVRAPCVLTPHPGEHARLTRATVADVQADRLTSAREAARAWSHTVVLKGAHTVIASPGGMAAVSPYANPGLASAGTGDVLAGTIAGLLAQGLAPFDAASCGVYLHAAAAEGLRGDLGDAGLLAGDLLPELPRTLRELKGLG